MTYDEIIKKVGKRIKKHVYYIKDGMTTRVSDESVERIKFDLQTPLIGTSMQTAEIELKEKIEGEIYVEVEAKYGSSTATKTYGAYHLKEEPTYDANKKRYIHKVGDNLIKSMVDYEAVNLTYPATIFEFFEAVIDKVGYSTTIASLPNGNLQMSTDIFNNIGFTYRDVLDDIAVANGVLFYVEGNELKIATLGGNAITINDDILKNQNIQFGEHFGAINTIVLSRSGESDNIYYPATLPENPIEFKIVDNQLMNENNRVEFLPALYNQLNGIEYDIYDTELTGWGDVKPLQTVNFETGNNTYTSYIFNNEITLTDGYKQAIYNELPEQTETDYKAASKTDKTINQAYIIVRKNEAEIESLARRVVDVSDTKTGTGQVQLENAHAGLLHKLSFYGDISLIFPSSDLYPSSTLYPRGSYLLIDNNEYKLDFDILRYYSATVYDEFVYEDGKCKIIRRVGVDSQGNMYSLASEVTEPRNDIYLEVNSNSIIKLKSFNNAHYEVEYLLENVYTDNFATQVDVSSQITQTNNKIEATVSQVADENGEVTAGSILLAVNKDESQAKIQADKIALEGYTTINGNFKVDEDGNMEANNGKLNNVNIEDGSIIINNGQYSTASVFELNSTEDGSYLHMYSDRAILQSKKPNVRIDIRVSDEDGNTPSLKIFSANTATYIYSGSISTDYVTAYTKCSSAQFENLSLAEKKKNFELLKSGLDIIKNIDIYKYHYKDLDLKKKKIGFVIGKDFKYSEEVTSENNDGVDLYSFVSVCCKAIQEQQVEIENLKKEMEELKNAKNRI